jgi:hypothetical protein
VRTGKGRRGGRKTCSLKDHSINTKLRLSYLNTIIVESEGSNMSSPECVIFIFVFCSINISNCNSVFTEVYSKSLSIKNWHISTLWASVTMHQTNSYLPNTESKINFLPYLTKQFRIFFLFFLHLLYSTNHVLWSQVRWQKVQLALLAQSSSSKRAYIYYFRDFFFDSIDILFLI